MMNAPARPEQATGNDDLIQRVGQLARMLRDSMRELGLNHEIERAAEAIPDARDRLNYVARMTEQAADRALNAIDRAQPIQEKLGSDAEALEAQWQTWFDSSDSLELDDARDLVRATRGYLQQVPAVTADTNKELLEIMMAQDFQDLTGQVIKKMMEVIQEVERQLLQVLLDNISNADDRQSMQKRVDHELGGDAVATHGPQVREDAEDVVNNQDQVDDLLEELGF